MAPTGEDVHQSVRRDRWLNRPTFVLACVGSSIGLGNFWKFPYLTFKHGGWWFILAYAVAMMVVGFPMLVLELTLGQKMQRGSAGALRGITPRLAGAGWAASVAGFFHCMVYNILLALCLIYMVQGGKQPWAESKYERTDGCNTALMKGTSSAELFFYMDTVNLFDQQSCQIFEYGDQTIFSWGLYLAVLITWIICFLCVMFGVKSSSYVVIVTNTCKFLFLFMLMGFFLSLNKKAGGLGPGFYLGGEKYPTGKFQDGTIQYYDPASVRGEVISDAFNQVLYSVGLGVGVFFSYGSYNHLKKPVIMDSAIIVILDFLFSILAGFVAWGAIGYLQINDSTAAFQNSSVGLAFIAFAEATSLEEDNGKGWFTFLMFTLFIAGLDSAFSYVESVVTNIVDEFKANRTGAAFFVCFCGAVLSLFFTSNFGWVLFDLVDHYITGYVILGAALMQCVSVGWCFERESTANMSAEHAKSLKWLAIMYWFPMVTLSFYSNFAFKAQYEIGIILIFITSFLALAVSFYVVKDSGFSSRSWYHEIMLCGVDKLSMSITCLSGDPANPVRSPWMLLFEGYFGIMIKYFVPACLTFLLMMNLSSDLENPYAEQPAVMQMYGTIFIYLIVMVFVGSMFMCDYAEMFWHDVNKEFDADNQFAAGLRGLKKAKTQVINNDNQINPDGQEEQKIEETELPAITKTK